MNADLLNLDSASCPRPSGRWVLGEWFPVYFPLTSKLCYKEARHFEVQQRPLEGAMFINLW